MRNSLGKNKKNIAIFIDNLHVGGIQKSIVNILRELDYNKYNVDVYLFDTDNFYELPSEVNTIVLNKPLFIYKFVFFDIAKKILKIDVLDKEYDIAIDFDSYQVHTALGAINVNAKRRAIWVHNDIPIKLKEEFKYKILHFFFKGKYKYFDTFCAVSKGALDSFEKIHYIKNKNYLVIPNYIDVCEIRNKMNEESDALVDKNKINIVSVGRLCHQKGYDIMLGNIKEMSLCRNDFHLYIIGDGPDHEKLIKMVKNLDLESYVTFLGNQKNPFKYLKQMDLFYLSSRYEGQGMVILEALCVGLDVLIPKHLEKYCPMVKGTEDIISFLKKYKKKRKKMNDLKIYNENISNQIDRLFGGDDV